MTVPTWILSTSQSARPISAMPTAKVMRDSRQYFHRYIGLPLSNYFQKYLRQIQRRDVEHGRALALEVSRKRIGIGAHDVLGGSLAAIGADDVRPLGQGQRLAHHADAAEVGAHVVQPRLQQ